jgi:hypothetical protein
MISDGAFAVGLPLTTTAPSENISFGTAYSAKGGMAAGKSLYPR